MMTADDDDVLASLGRAIEGDIMAFVELVLIGNVRVVEAWHEGGRPPMSLSRGAVVSVLTGILDRSLPRERARDWAFFVRHGLLGGLVRCRRRG